MMIIQMYLSRISVKESGEIMNRFFRILAAALAVLPVFGGVNAQARSLDNAQPVTVSKIDGLPDDFITGADISGLISLEASGREFYGFDGKKQDLLKTLGESGVNYIRVRVWNDPFDENGNGYGGGNCTVDTAIALGKRAAAYGMGLLVDFHYSDFWADPGKQQAPKAWQDMTLDEKAGAVYDFTAQSIGRIRQSGVEIGMVQVGNETTGGFCGETDKANRYRLMRTAAQAVRDTDGSIRIVTHFTNPEKMNYAEYAEDLAAYGVDYDIFSTSYYPEYHGTIDNLKDQLEEVHRITGKKVMIAETSWAYDSDAIGSYKRNVQGQADEIADCIAAMKDLGDCAVGVFYWEPAWIDVPGDTEQERAAKRELYGAGWASSYAGSYDPDDAGRYYGATACIPTALFDPDGYPLDSLRTFLYIRQGTAYAPQNHIADPSFESGGADGWTITEANAGTVDVSDNASDARDGSRSLHFWNSGKVTFTAEQTISGLSEGNYAFSVSAQGGSTGDSAVMKIYAVSGGVRYERRFSLDGWRSWKVPMIADIPCSGGEITVGISVDADAGAWGSFDCTELVKEATLYLCGDADCDGEVSILDATAIQRMLADYPVDPFDENAADVTGDGTDIVDATYIQRFLADYSDGRHIGEVAC